MTDALPENRSKESDPAPAYVTALTAVLAQAEDGLEYASSTDSMEMALRKLAQLTSVYRVYDVRNIVAQRQSALLAGALTRSLVESALAEDWYASRPAEESPRSATLAAERQNIVDAVADSGLTVPNLHRWNNPIPEKRFASAPPGPSLPNIQSTIAKNAGTSIERTLILPAPLVDVLGMCSHVNHTATWLTAGDDASEIGVTASPELAAILAQSAGMSIAAIHGFSRQGPTLDLVAAATAAHDFDVAAPRGKARTIEDLKPKQPQSDGQDWLEREAPPSVFDDILKDAQDKALVVWKLVNEAPDPFAGPNLEVNLVSALPYLAARDLLLLTIRSTFGDCSPLLAPTGARMLLEQGSEIAWRFSDPSDVELLMRYEMHMDYATDKKKALESSLRNRTSSVDAIERLLYPRGRGDFAIDNRRMPNSQKATIPSPQDHLSEMTLGEAQPYWALAYKLLTQAAHATPLGLLHAVARTDPETQDPRLSHEMTALAIDSACAGAALTFRALAPLITHQAGQDLPREWLIELFAAVQEVHLSAQKVHFLG